MRMRTLDPGWAKFGSAIRDKHAGSATLNVRTFVVFEDGLVQDVLLLAVAEGGVGKPGRQQLFRPGISLTPFTMDFFRRRLTVNNVLACKTSVGGSVTFSVRIRIRGLIPLRL
jgi:hypothetical protein